MKRLAMFLWLPLLLLALALPAWAAPTVSGLQSDTFFQADGSCQVTLSLTLRLSDPENAVELPLPSQAQQITVNNQPAQTRQEQQLLWVTLPVSGGTCQVTVRYLLKGLVSADKSGTFLTLPILSGLYYPVERFSFSVTLPEAVSTQPTFESGYYLQNVGEILEYTTEGATISGKSKTPLKDRETLVMTLQVPKDFFREAPRHFSLPDGWDLAICFLVAGAVLYYILTLMPKFPGKQRRATAPDGITAGDVGTCLTGCGTDLTMLVMTWAQLGYITIEMDHKNRVTLHKRMEMGNERDGHEVRWFKSLFGQRTMVDADSYHYAKLCRKLAVKSPLLGQLYDRKSGNPLIFRAMCVVVGIVAGLQMGLGMGLSAGAKTLLGLSFALLCGAFSYFIQSGGKCLPLREKTPLGTALGCGAVWIAMGVLARDLQQAVPMVIFQFLAGIAAAYGGKRSDMGMRCLSQLRGLRRHMLTTGTFDMQQLLQKNPNYFFELAPYALALGIDRSFARRFGKMPLPEESFLLCGAAREMTAAQFTARLRKAADILNTRQKQLPYEQFKGK